MPLPMILALVIGIAIIVLTYPNHVSEWFWTKVFELFKHE